MSKGWLGVVATLVIPERLRRGHHSEPEVSLNDIMGSRPTCIVRPYLNNIKQKQSPGAAGLVVSRYLQAIIRLYLCLLFLHFKPAVSEVSSHPR